MSITICPSEQEERFINFWKPILSTVLNGVGELTSLSYQHSIQEFLGWWFQSGEGHPVIAVTSYRKHLLEQNLKPATINKKLSAIRRLFDTAAVVGIGKENWVLNFEVALAIKGIKNVPQHGRLHGTRLEEDQIKQLCQKPDKTTLLGRRDRAVLALLIGSGLRRSELAGLTWGQIKRDGQIWIIQDLVGKHGRVRSPLIPSWAYQILTEYSDKGKDHEKVVVAYDRHGNSRGSITAKSIYDIVVKYSNQLELGVKPHDLRRSNARFLRDAGADIEDIQAELGHSSPDVTSKYIGRTGHMEKLEDLWKNFTIT